MNEGSPGPGTEIHAAEKKETLLDKSKQGDSLSKE